MTLLKLDVPLFDEMMNFTLWQCTIQDYFSVDNLLKFVQ